MVDSIPRNLNKRKNEDIKLNRIMDTDLTEHLMSLTNLLPCSMTEKIIKQIQLEVLLENLC